MKPMDALAAARPANLDGRPDADRRHRDLDAALAQPLDAARPRRRRMPVKAGLAVLAVGAAGAVALAVVARPASTANPGRAHLSGQPIMLAADRAEALPIGRYWISDTIFGQSYVVSAKTGKYVIAGAGHEDFEWTSVKPGGGNLDYGRTLPVRPQTATDEAAWRRAGSPNSFRVWSLDHYDTFTTATGRWKADKPQARPGGRFSFTGAGGKTHETTGATFKQLQELSTDPAQLRERYVKAQGGSAPHELLAVGEDLMSAPVPPRLRAGIMRMIPTLPGVYPVGTVTDPLGRSGIAYAADWPTTGRAYHGFGYRTEVIFGKDGQFLGEENVLTKPGAEYAGMRPGLVLNYHVARKLAWVNDKPASPPVKLPF